MCLPVVHHGCESRSLFLSQGPCACQQEPPAGLQTRDLVQTNRGTNAGGVGGESSREVCARTHFNDCLVGGTAVKHAGGGQLLGLKGLPQQPAKE